MSGNTVDGPGGEVKPTHLGAHTTPPLIGTCTADALVFSSLVLIFFTTGLIELIDDLNSAMSECPCCAVLAIRPHWMHTALHHLLHCHLALQPALLCVHLPSTLTATLWMLNGAFVPSSISRPAALRLATALHRTPLDPAFLASSTTTVGAATTYQVIPHYPPFLFISGLPSPFLFATIPTSHALSKNSKDLPESALQSKSKT
ncbi:hypothetical protein B0H19DRAFT_1384975 [Mycena capillaripes]|nr:hypothetical protein B0H19DRAFT_1384975 [Mycena capillaripes]